MKLHDLRNMFNKIVMMVCGCFPIRKNKIIFSSFDGKLYNDSPRIISEALSKYKIDQVWVLPSETEVPWYIRTVTQGSIHSIYELATAKVWVDNTRKKIYVKKRKGQYYIQTWHGGVALKKVEKDAENTLTKKYIKRAINDSKMIDLMVSESRWRTENYLTAFWYSGEIIEAGIAHQNLDISNNSELKNKVYKSLNISIEKRIILYAPTFRDAGNLSPYDIDYKKLLESTKEKFGGDWVVVIRLHPNIIKLEKQITYSENIINGSEYPILQDIMLCSDVVITDFSGLMFDALRLEKILFLYASDYENYIAEERELYFDLTNFPASLSKTNDELRENIINFDLNSFNIKRLALLDKIGFCSDGSEKVIDRIKSVMELK